MKHLYNPKSKIPFRPLMTLALFAGLMMVSLQSYGQGLKPLRHSASQTINVPSEDINLTNARLNAYRASDYNDLQIEVNGNANVAFNCADGLGYILTNVSSPNGNVTGLYSFDLSTNTLSVIKDPLIATTNTSQFVNAIGYNVVDNFLYGYLQGSDKVVKIDSNGDIELLDIVGLVGTNYPSGDVDENGILYLFGQGRFVSIDLNATSPNYLVANTLLQHSVSINDMAFSPVDNNIYMITSSSSRTLLRFNTTTNTMTTLGQVSGLSSESSYSFGTAYMDALGNMYIANNASGNTYKIATPHLGGLTATFYSNLPGVSPGDGARCPSQPTKPMAIADSVCMTASESEVTFNIATNDSEGTYALDPNSVQLIDPVTLQPTTTVTIAGQGTFTLGANAELTFEALSTFTGTSLSYTIKDVIGFTSIPAVITINLNDTAAPTGEATQVFCESESLTVADLQANGTNIQWYTSATSTTPLSTTETVDAGETYYASQTSAEGCESTTRFAVTVAYAPKITLIAPEKTDCTVMNGTSYTIQATFTGTAPFTATGDGQSGTFTANNDGTTTWVSGPIDSSVEVYNVTIENECESLVLSGDSPSECLNTPFDCEDGFAYIIINTGTGQQNYVSGLYTYDLNTNSQSLIKYPLIEDTSGSQFINGIGYNVFDNNIYGLQQGTRNIVKIDASGNIEFLPIVGAFDIGNYSSGDVDENGILFLHGENKFVSIDLNPSSANYLQSTTLLNYSVTINDLTFNPVDGNLYMMTSTPAKKLLRFNTTTNVLEDLGSVTGLNSEADNSFGTAFMDALGNMYVANNQSGNIYKIALPHNGNLAATYYSNLIDVHPGDGARCPAQITIPVAIDDYVCLTSEETSVEINVLDNDTSGTYELNPNSVQLVDPVTSNLTNIVTIAGQGTFTVGSNGVVLFEALPTFTGTSVDYVMADIIATSSMPATITVSVNETTAPTGDANQDFCASSDPTVADLMATGENIQWYATSNSTTALEATEALVDGNTYYATQTTSLGCVSLERFAVTVNFTADITLVAEEEITCSDDGTTYTVSATFTGEMPFTINGMAPTGTWIENDNDTFTWTSEALPSDQDYNFEIQDVNTCNLITLAGVAPNCCEFEVTCPTFEPTTVACYSDLPTETAYTIDAFEALGNADGMIGDNACGIIVITATNSEDQGLCEQTITRTYSIISYEDTNGNGVHDTDETNVINSTECTQTITVADTEAPSFTVPADLTVECDVDVTDLTITGDVTDEADNCATALEATYTDTVEAGTCPTVSLISRAWSLTDACDNTTTYTQVITVQDTTAPTFTAPADITIECDVDATDLNLTGEVTDIVDNCATNLEATYTDTVEDGTCPSLSVISRVWSVTDTCDNTATYTQIITVQDTTAPTFTVPADVTLECGVDVLDLSITGDVTDETDNCATGLEASFTDTVEDGTCPSLSIISREWLLMDACGNTTSLTQIITIEDTTAPTFTVPADITVECDVDVTDLSITGDVTDEADNCVNALEATYTDTVIDGSCPIVSEISRVWTLTDACDHTTSYTQTITVQDTTAPSFNETLPADLAVECDAVPTAEILTASDNCGTAEVSYEEVITNGACVGDYIIERTWTATDACGNDAVHTQIITVQDNTPPTVLTDFEANVSVTCDNIPEVPSLVFEDSCSSNIDVSFTEESTQTSTSEDYIITRTWSVIDDCGNEALFTQEISVELTSTVVGTDANLCILDSEIDLFDLLIGDFETNGSWTVVSGEATLDGSIFDPSSAQVGEYTFSYEASSQACPITAEVTITLDDDCVVLACGEDDVVISKTVTSNGDNINEFFTVTGVEDCGFVIELQIFNRWGAEIYKSNNYGNDWAGEAHGSSIGSSGKVPTGTYYYIINLKNSGLEPIAGPIYVATN